MNLAFKITMDNISDRQNLILEQALDEGISIESVNAKESLKLGFENLRALRRILVHHADLDGNISKKMSNNTEIPNIFFSLCFGRPVEKNEMIAEKMTVLMIMTNVHVGNWFLLVTALCRSRLLPVQVPSASSLLTLWLWPNHFSLLARSHWILITGVCDH